MQFSHRPVICALLCLAALAPRLAEAREQKFPPVRIAVLDLKAPNSTPWLGAAVAESVRVKLASVSGVMLLEREKIQSALLATKAGEVTPALLGTEYLFMGSVQLAGKWADAKTKIRISAKVIAAETAKIRGGASFVVDGTVGALFSLESRLAEKFAEALGKEPTALQIEYREERNLRAKKLFGEGLVKLSEAEALRGPLRKPRPTGTGEGGKGGTASTKVRPSPKILAKAASLLDASVKLFRQAQRENEGAFFARAHHYEGKARELLAKAQQDDAAAKKVRADTVKQFRQDAAAAAPAFYDLGRALEANTEYREAIEAYEQYLKWMSDAHRVIRWRLKRVSSRWHSIPAYFGTNIPFVSCTWEAIVATPSYLILLGPKVTVYRRKDHKKMWRKPVPGPSTELQPTWRSCNGNDRVLALLNYDKFYVFDTATGELLLQQDLPDLPGKWDVSHTHGVVRTMIYFIPNRGRPRIVAVAREAVSLSPDTRMYSSRSALIVIDLKAKKVMWKKTWAGVRKRIYQMHVTQSFLPKFWAGAFLCGYPPGRGGKQTPAPQEELGVYDAETGEDASARFGADALRLAKLNVLLFPDETGKGRYILGPKGVRHLAGPKAKIVETPAKVFSVLVSAGRFTGMTPYLLPPQKERLEVGQWLGYDLVTKRFSIRKDPLPIARLGNEKRVLPVVSRGKRMWSRTWAQDSNRQACRGRRFFVFDTVEGGKPRLQFDYTFPWRVFSQPIFGDDSMFLFVSKSGRGGCDVVEVGLPKSGRGAISEPAVCARIAACHERRGELRSAVDALQDGVEAYYNLPELHESLAELYERLGKLGDCSRECEILVHLYGQDHAQGKKALATYARVLGRVEGVPPDAAWCKLVSPSAAADIFAVYLHGTTLCGLRLPEKKPVWRCELEQKARVTFVTRGDVVVALERKKKSPHTLVSVDIVTGAVLARKELPPGLGHLQPIDDRYFNLMPLSWRKRVPVFIWPHADATEFVALEPRTLKPRWTCTLPKAGRDSHRRYIIQRDRVFVGTILSGNLEALIQCRTLGDGALLWERKLPSPKPERLLTKEDGLFLETYGSVIMYCFHSLGAPPAYFSARNGGKYNLKPVRRLPWFIYALPGGESAFLDVEAKLTPPRTTPNSAYREKYKARLNESATQLWPGGPVLIGDVTDPIAAIFDPRTAEPLCRSRVGLQRYTGDFGDILIHGGYVLSGSQVLGRTLIFREEQFLRAIGWTEELDRKYRKLYPPIKHR